MEDRTKERRRGGGRVRERRGLESARALPLAALARKPGSVRREASVRARARLPPPDSARTISPPPEPQAASPQPISAQLYPGSNQIRPVWSVRMIESYQIRSAFCDGLTGHWFRGRVSPEGLTVL